MKKTKKMSGLGRLLVTALFMTVVALGLLMSASADDLVWNLLTDTEAGYKVEDRQGSWNRLETEDGTPYVSNYKRGAFFIWDDNNILGTYRTFSLEGDFYFNAFPTGVRDAQNYTPEQSPLSFLCWIYENKTTQTPTRFNAVRIDSKGYLYTGNDGAGKTDIQLELGKWYNIRCVFTPQSGISEMFINGEKMLDFNIIRFDPNVYSSYAVRYFDNYFDSWQVEMKNLIVKTDSEYTIELKREPAADYVGYQVTKPEDGKFSLRTVLGVNDLGYNRIGYEVILLDTDDEGRLVADTLGARSKVVYETVCDSLGNTYSAKDTFGYSYLAALRVDDIPIWPTGTVLEVVVRPYVLGMDGIRRYGNSVTLSYDGQRDADGYPILEAKKSHTISVAATDDTYIFNHGGSGLTAFGDATTLYVKNTGDVNTYDYQAAYVQFTLDADTVKALDSAVSAKLRIYVKSVEGKDGDLLVHAADSNWKESTLTYKSHTDNRMGATQDLVYEGPFKREGYISIDVLGYLREQLVAEDGTLTVSFRISNAGGADAALISLRSKESGYAPTIEIKNSMYDLSLNYGKMANAGYEPFGYAEMLVDEWFGGLRDKIYPKDENGDVIYYDDLGAFAPLGYAASDAKGDFSQEIVWKYDTVWTNKAASGYKVSDAEWEQQKFARTLSTLGTSAANRFLESSYAETLSEYDVYGGITNAGFKGEATGFFHTERHGVRTYIIDPLGNPFFAVGMNDVSIGSTANQKAYSLSTFETRENYFKEITASLKEMGVNVAFESDYATLLEVQSGLPAVVMLPGLRRYMASIGREQVSEGVFPFNNTLNVFDPDFEKSMNSIIPEAIKAGGYADNPQVFGYTVDNELPSGKDILERYLMLNPDEDAGNAFSYATAWTWLARRLDNPVPTLADVQESPDRAALNSEFLAFVYARNYGVIRDAIRTVDQNHMYLGSRAHGLCYTDEGYHRAAGYYLDVLTINLYGGMNPLATTISGIYRNSGKPFIVTEFFAKGMDAIDANGYPLANSCGAGIVVETQRERADYYEHYAMALLESKACVGWVWYRFRDNDQSLYSTGSNTLIMLYVTYGELPTAHTFMDEHGNILPAKDIGGIYYTTYWGDAMASNQNINKGVYNNNFNSTVTVYTYDRNGKLTDSKSYEVLTPESEHPADGTTLTARKDGRTFTVGTVVGEDGGYTETVLTVYKGKYLALSGAIQSISDHMMGIVNYFDANENE
ncbi:MAG: DNRLRE domain-containing protein [Clostridia bacterium]|nr:DNRLRE domain-containing protein [Clostridia bacterium]